jgi:hypothetical protein
MFITILSIINSIKILYFTKNFTINFIKYSTKSFIKGFIKDSTINFKV